MVAICVSVLTNKDALLASEPTIVSRKLYNVRSEYVHQAKIGVLDSANVSFRRDAFVTFSEVFKAFVAWLKLEGHGPYESVEKKFRMQVLMALFGGTPFLAESR